MFKKYLILGLILKSSLALAAYSYGIKTPEGFDGKNCFC